jgi:hypothetical protein
MPYHSSSSPLQQLQHTQTWIEGIEVAAMRKLDILNQKPLNCSKRYRMWYRASNDRTFP